jgi:hypothetical protein
MAKILIKRSDVAGFVPATTDLSIGELQLNTTDGKMFMKRSVLTVESILEIGKDAATAVKLMTGRKINGVVFDGTQDISFGTNSVLEESNLYYTQGRFDSAFGNKTTTNLFEGTNLYYTQARFDAALGAKTTNDLTEGSNLYYTQARFNTAFAAKSTTNLTEGTNLYYTNARASAAAPVQTVAGRTGNVVINLSDVVNAMNKTGDTMTGALILNADPVLPLGAATKNYVDTQISGGTASSANKLTTARNINSTPFDGTHDISFTTDVTAEGTSNLYYTQARFDAAFAAKSTTNLAEGTNLYYTNARASAAAPVQTVAGRNGNVVLAVADVSGAAPLASPALTGIPIAPTAASGTNTTQLATTAFVSNAVSTATGGSVASALKWTNARSLSITGDATATLAAVDGSADVSSALTLATVNSNVGSFGAAANTVILTANAKGLITAVSATPIDIATSQVTSGTFADARIAASNVTQHQAALTIVETQITNGGLLARVADNETIAGTWTFNNAVTGIDPTNATHYATKQYVDNITTGLDFKASVKVATTTNIALTGTQTIDGVAVVAGDRVLVKDQTTATQNGIYVVAAGAWARSLDADNTPGQEVSAGLYCFIEQGTTNGDTGWVLTTDGAIVLGTTSLTFAQFTGLGQVIAGNGLTKTGSTISALSASATRIVSSVGGLDLALVTDSGTGLFRKLNTDGYGRVTGTTSVIPSDITSALGFTPVNKAGDAMTGPLTVSGAITSATSVNATGHVFAGNPTASVGGNGQIKFYRDTGVLGWAVGVDGSAGGTNLILFDMVGNTSRVTVAPDGTFTSFVAGSQRFQTTTLGATVSGTLSATNLQSTGLAYLNGATGAYTGVSSGVTINYTGNGTQYGIALKPASNTAVTQPISFLTSTSTYGAGVAMASIQQISDTTMNLSGLWTAGTQPPSDNSQLIATTAFVTNAISQGNTSGNAATATKLQTARTINGVAFDGTANITVADATKLPLTGGTLTGNLNVTTSGSSTSILITDTGANGANIKLVGNGATTPIKYVRSQNGNFQVLNDAYSTPILTVTDAGALTVPGIVTAPSFTGNLTGNLTGYKNVDNTNEMTLANGFAGGQLNMNYRGASGAITQVNVWNGITASGVLAKIVALNIDASGNTTGNAATATSAQTVTNAAQPAITSVGTLTSLNVAGAITSTTNITATGNVTGRFVISSVSPSLAAAGSTQGNGASITNQITVISTATAGTAQAVVLPVPVAGQTCILINTTGVTISVFPSASVAIDALGLNAAYSLGPNARLMFVATTTSQWYTMTGVYA